MDRRLFLGQLSALFAAGAAAATPRAVKAALSPDAKPEPAFEPPAPTPRTLAQDQLSTVDVTVPIGQILRPMRERPGCYLVSVRMAVPMRLTQKAQEAIRKPLGHRDRSQYVWLRDIEEIAISADEGPRSLVGK